jgi:tetratricopeptide (TPR) repeat protein
MNKKHYARAGCGAGLVLAILVSSGCVRSPEAKEAAFLDAGKNALAKKDYARALIQFRNAAVLKKGDAEPYQAALAYIGTGDYTRGAQALNKALQLDPKHLKAQIKLAELLRATGKEQNLAEAETRIKGVLAISPGNADALNAQALTEWDRGRFADARRSLAQAVEQAPQNLLAANNLAIVKRAENDFAGAEKVYKSAITSNPHLAAPLVMLGNFYTDTQRSDAAEQQYRRALQIDAKNVPALLRLADLYATAHRSPEAEKIYSQISALPDPRLRPLHAIFLFKSGKREEAIAEFARLAKADSLDRDARTRLIEAYFAVNRISDVEKLLTDALRKNGKDTDALLQRSRVYLLAGNYDEARKDLAQVLHFQSDSSQAHYLMAKVLGADRAWSSQKQELGQALQTNQSFLPARLELARLLIAGNAAKSALSVLDNGIPESQRNVLQFVVLRNWAVFATNDLPEFSKGVAKAMTLGRTPDVLLQNAVLKLVQHDPAGARKSLQEILQQNPEETRALDLMARSYAPKQTAQGLQFLRDYAAQHPKSARIQLYLGRVLMSLPDQAGARRALAASLEATPGLTAAEFSLARLDSAEGKLDDARKRLTALSTSHRAEIPARTLLAGIEERSGNRAAAIDHLRKVLDLDPNNLVALNDLAYLLSDNAKQTDEALKYAQHAKELAPDSLDVADTLGWVLYRKGLYQESLRYLETAAGKQATSVRKYHLAMAYFKLGRQKLGQQTLDAAIHMNPGLSPELIAEARQKGN